MAAARPVSGVIHKPQSVTPALRANQSATLEQLKTKSATTDQYRACINIMHYKRHKTSKLQQKQLIIEVVKWKTLKSIELGKLEDYVIGVPWPSGLVH